MNYELGLTLRTNGAEDRFDRFERGARGANRELDRTQDRLDRAARSSRTYGEATDRSARSTDRATRSSRSYGNAAATSARQTDRAAQSSGNLTKANDRLGQSLGRSVRNLALATGGVLTFAGAIGQVKTSIGVFEGFEKRMAGVQAVSGATERQFGQLEAQTRELGKTTIFSATQAAEAQENLARAGFTVEENLAALPATLDLAASSELGLATAADIAAGTLRGFQVDAGNTSEIVDVLATTAAISNTRVEDMGDALKFAAPTAQSLGVSLKDTSAAMAVLADNMLKGTLGGTGFRQAMLGIIDPSGKAEDVLTDLGISAELFRTTLEEKGLVAALELLISRTSGITEAVQLAGARGGTALQILITNLDRLAQKRSDLEDVTDAANDMAAIRMDTVAGDMAELRSVIESLRIDFGEALAPALRAALDRLTEFFGEGSDGARKFGREVGTAIGAAVEAFIFLSKFVDAAKASLLAFFAVKVLQFFTLLVGWLAKGATSLAAYATATGAAATATGGLAAAQTTAVGTTNALAAATARTVPIFGAQGQVISVVTQQTLGLGAAQTAQGAAAAGATGATSRFLSAGLTPLAVGLGVVLAAVLLVNDAITDWSAKLDQEIAGIVASSQNLMDAIEGIKNATKELLDVAVFEAEVEQALLKAGVKPEDAEAAAIRAQVAADFQRQRVDLLTQEETALAALREEEAGYRSEIETTAERLAALREQQAEANERLVTASRGRSEFAGISEAAELGKISAQVKAAEEEMTRLTTTAAEAHIKVRTLEGSVGQLREAAEAYVPSQKKLTKSIGDGNKKLDEAAKKYAKLKADLEQDIDSLNALADAYERNDGSAQGVLDTLDKEARLRQISIDLTEDQRKELEELIDTQIQAERRATGAQTIANLEDQLEAMQALTAAYDDGDEAVAKVEKALDDEAVARDLVADAAENQEQKIRDLLKALAEEERAQAFKSAEQGIQIEINALERLRDAYDDGSAAVRRVTRELEIEEAVRQATVGLIGDERDAIEAAVRAREALADEVGGEQYLAALREENELLRIEANLLEELSPLQRLFGDATRQAALELEIQRRILEAGVDPASDYADEIRRITEEQFALSESIDGTQNLASEWINLGNTIAGILDGIDSDLANTLRNAVNVAQSIQALSQTDGGVNGAIAGAQTGSAIAGFGIGLGLAEGDRGVGRLGGQLSGDYADVGAEIGGAVGGAFGPVWGIVGAAAGFIIGAFIKKGADEALATFRQQGEDLQVEITKVEGGLGPALQELVGGILTTVRDLELLVGGEITTGTFGVKIRDDIVTVFINGISQAFEGDTAIQDAVAFAVSELLKTAEFDDNIGENVQTALSSGGFESLDELDAVLRLAQALDDGAAAASPFADAMREIISARKNETALAREHGLAISDVLKLTNQRIAALKREAEGLFNSILGVTDHLAAAQDFETAVTAFNNGLESESNQRHRLLADQEANVAAMEEQHARTGGLIEAMGGLDNALALAEQAGIDFSVEGVERTRNGLLDSIHTWQRLEETLPGAQAELEATRQALAELPEAIEAEKIAEAYRVAGSQAALDLIGLLQQVQGEQFLAAEQQHLQAVLYQLQLAAQIASVQTLLAATELLDDATRAVLEGIIVAANEVLEGLTDGTINFNPGNFGGGGGGVSRPRGDNGAARREEQRADIIREIEDLRLAAEGVSATALELRNQLRDFDEWIENARELGIAEEHLAQARLDQLQLIEQDLLRPFEEIIRQAGESDLQTGVRQLGEQFQEALESAFVLATERAEQFGTDLGDEFGPMRDTILEAFGINLGEQIRDRINSLTQSGDLDGLQDLVEELLGMDLSGISPDLQRAFEGILDALVQDAQTAIDALEATESDGSDVEADVDLSAIQEFLDLLDGVSATEQTLRDIQSSFAGVIAQLRVAEASEEDLARVRDAHTAAINNVRDAILDSVRSYLDAVQGIGEFERKLLNLQETFSTARDGIDDVGNAIDSQGDLFAPPTKDDDGIEIATKPFDELPILIAEKLDPAREALDMGLTAMVDVIHAAAADLGVEPTQHGIAPKPGVGGPIATKPATLPGVQILEDLPILIADIDRTGKPAADTMSDLSDELALLEAAERRAVQQLGVDFIGSLENLGVALPTELTMELAQAQFALAQAEAVSAALALAAAGAFDEMSIGLQDVLDLIAGAQFGNSQFAPQVPNQSGGGGGGTSPADEAANFRVELARLIDEWNRLEFGALTNEAIQLARRFNDAQAEAERLGISTDELAASYRIAVGNFVDNALEPFERLGEGTLERELNDLVDRFTDMREAFHAAGADAEQLARLQTAFTTAMSDFVDRATAGITSFLEELKGNDPRVSDEQRFLDSQSEFRDLLARAQGGDLEAIEQLEAAARLYSQEAGAFLGSGIGSQNVLDEIIGGLEGIADLDLVPEDIALLQAQADRLDELVAFTTQQPTQATQSGGFTAVQQGIAENQTALSENQQTLADILAQLEGGELTVEQIDEMLGALAEIAQETATLPLVVDDVIDSLTGILEVADPLTQDQIADMLEVIGGVLTVEDALTEDQLIAVQGFLENILGQEALSEEQLVDAVALLDQLTGETEDQLAVISDVRDILQTGIDIESPELSAHTSILTTQTAILQSIDASLQAVPLLQEGGRTAGSGLAFLHPNEIVLSRAQTSAFEELVETLGSPRVDPARVTSIEDMATRGRAEIAAQGRRDRAASDRYRKDRLRAERDARASRGARVGPRDAGATHRLDRSVSRLIASVDRTAKASDIAAARAAAGGVHQGAAFSGALPQFIGGADPFLHEPQPPVVIMPPSKPPEDDGSKDDVAAQNALMAAQLEEMRRERDLAKRRSIAQLQQGEQMIGRLEDATEEIGGLRVDFRRRRPLAGGGR